MRAAWLAIVVAGFVAGAGTVLLTDPGTSEPRVIVTAAAASQGGANSAINGQHIHGVKNGDIAPEALPDKPLDQTTRALLAMQLTVARSTALRYPTVADAKKAGYILAGGFAPGSGAHYVRTSAAVFASDHVLNVNRPGSLIYEGTNPTSKIIGMMYIGGGTTPPDGFVGPNDHWHRHSAVCVKYGPGGIEVPFPADADITPKQCQDVHGQFMAITVWMVHAWVVPGWESPLGVFSHDNPNIRCADDTFNTNKAGFCQGV